MGTNLKKALFSLFSTAFLLNLSIPAGFPSVAVAETLSSAGETRIEQGREGVIRDLGVETTGILPSNPFYFFKEWGRGIRKALSFSPLKRVELQLDIANEQAAEIAKLRELNITGSDAYDRAVANYNASLALVRDRLLDVGGAPTPTRFSLVFIDRALKHSDILDTLYADMSAADPVSPVIGQIRAARFAIVKTVATLVGQIDNTERVAEYLRTAIGKQGGKWRELKAVEFLNRLEDAGVPDLGDELVKLRAHLLQQLVGRLQGATLNDFQAAEDDGGNVLERLPGVPVERLRVLDALREVATDSDMKNYVNLIRSKLFDRIRSDNLVSEADAKAMMKQVSDVLAAVDAFMRVKGSIIFLGTRVGAERARFAYDSAVKFVEEGASASAYGQASAAHAAIERVYADLLLGNGDVGSDVRALKQDFDDLDARVRAAGMKKNAQPELFAALADAERAIAKVADLVNVGAAVERVLDSIGLSKRLISAAAEFLEKVNAPPAGAAGALTEARMPSAREAQVFVDIVDGQFVPAVVKVKKGGTVVWINRDTAPHWVVSAADASRAVLLGFDAQKEIVGGAQYQFVFDRRGTWKYRDRLHPEMVGVVDVE